MRLLRCRAYLPLEFSAMPSRDRVRPVSSRPSPSSKQRRSRFFESLEDRRLLANNILNFDDVSAPEAFAYQQELTTQYADRGVTFSGRGGPGWEVLDQSGDFGVDGYSSPNFLAWNTD